MARRHHGGPRRNATRKAPAPGVAAVDRVLLAGGGIGPLPGQSLDAVEGQLKALDLPPERLEQLVRGVLSDAVLGEVLQSLAVAVLHDLAQARRPLDAEVTVCDVFGMIALTAPEEVVAGEPERLRDVLLAFLVDHAAKAGTASGLALLRVLSVLGPEQVRCSAQAEAERVASSGVPDRPWAKTVGRPRLLRAWHYGDVWGSQASVGLLFDYSGREHALLTLIDYNLGGGVKDCWVAEGRDARSLRDRAVEVEAEQDAFFEDLDAERAARVLRAALARPFCPEQDDQVECVAQFGELLRSRAELVAELAGLPPEQPVIVTGDDLTGRLTAASLVQAVEDRQAEDEILRIKVSLADTTPPIWRRLEVPASLTLIRLHVVLQGAFGWSGSHLHQFERGTRRTGLQVIEGRAEQRTRLYQVLAAAGDALVYRYDFGDDWEHRIVLEARGPVDADRRYPSCTAGGRSAPPEDSGGVPGYEHLLEVLADPGHPEYEELRDWVPAGFDPAAFCPDDVNVGLARLP